MTSDDSNLGSTVHERPGTAESESTESGDDESSPTTGQVDALYGKEFAGRYHVGEAIGKGGYGRVYRAKEFELERDVALKVLKSNRGGYTENNRKRFIREAKLVAGLQEPHTIKLYDYGESEGFLYLAFEFVDGQTLGEYVSDKGPLKPFELAKLLEQILDSLHEAHEQGVLHRDIKPSNIMVYEHERRGLEVKVLDFGIGKVLEREDREVTELTAEGTLMGTPRYMSPEQMRGDELGPPTDLWSLGVVALEALIGERVIKTTKTMEVTTRILDPGPEPFRVPSSVDVPPFFRRLIERLLQKSVSQRYQTTEEVLDDLSQLRLRERTPVQMEVETAGGIPDSEKVTAKLTDGDVGSDDLGADDAADEPTARRDEKRRAEDETVASRPRGERRQFGAAHLVVGALILAVGAWGVRFVGSSGEEIVIQPDGGEAVAEMAPDQMGADLADAVVRRAERVRFAAEADESRRRRIAGSAREVAGGVVSSGTSVGKQLVANRTRPAPRRRVATERATDDGTSAASAERDEQIQEEKPAEPSVEHGPEDGETEGSTPAAKTPSGGESESKEMKVWGVE